MFRMHYRIRLYSRIQNLFFFFVRYSLSYEIFFILSEFQVCQKSPDYYLRRFFFVPMCFPTASSFPDDAVRFSYGILFHKHAARFSYGIHGTPIPFPSPPSQQSLLPSSSCIMITSKLLLLFSFPPSCDRIYPAQTTLYRRRV